MSVMQETANLTDSEGLPPEKLSDLLYLVISDIKNMSPDIELDMNYYRRRVGGEVCSVCLGGALILGHFPDTDDLLSTPKAWQKSMYALDAIRILQIDAAYYFYNPGLFLGRSIQNRFTAYCRNSDISPMRGVCKREDVIIISEKIANWLRVEGL